METTKDNMTELPVPSTVLRALHAFTNPLIFQHSGLISFYKWGKGGEQKVLQVMSQRILQYSAETNWI